jgi:hypothetical protein
MGDKVTVEMVETCICRSPDPAGTELQVELATLQVHFAYAQRTMPRQLTFVRCNISVHLQSLTVNALLGRFLPRFYRATSAVFFALVTNSILMLGQPTSVQGSMLQNLLFRSQTVF